MSATSGASPRSTCSPSPTSAARVPRYGMPGRASSSRTCSMRRARALAGDRGGGLQDSLRARQDEARAPAAAQRHPRWRRSRAVEPSRRRVFPAPYRRRDRVACAQPALARRSRRAGGAGTPHARRHRTRGDDLPAGPEGALRAHLRLLRPRRAVDSRGARAHHAQRLRARHLRRARSLRIPTRPSARRSSMSSTSCASCCASRGRSSLPERDACRGASSISR